MKVRVLDADRSCLQDTPVTDLGPLFPEDRVRTVVVEEDGKVVGSMTVVLVPHIEATWIDPSHRNAGVARALRRATWALASEGGASWCFTSARDISDEMLLERLGGHAVPARFYFMPLNGRA